VGHDMCKVSEFIQYTSLPKVQLNVYDVSEPCGLS